MMLPKVNFMQKREKDLKQSIPYFIKASRIWNKFRLFLKTNMFEIPDACNSPQGQGECSGQIT